MINELLDIYVGNMTIANQEAIIKAYDLKSFTELFENSNQGIIDIIEGKATSDDLQQTIATLTNEVKNRGITITEQMNQAELIKDVNPQLFGTLVQNIERNHAIIKDMRDVLEQLKDFTAKALNEYQLVYDMNYTPVLNNFIDLNNRLIELSAQFHINETKQSETENILEALVLNEEYSALQEARNKLEQYQSENKRIDDIITENKQTQNIPETQLQTLQKKKIETTEINKVKREIARLEKKFRNLLENSTSNIINQQKSILESLQIEAFDLIEQQNIIGNETETLKQDLFSILNDLVEIEKKGLQQLAETRNTSVNQSRQEVDNITQQRKSVVNQPRQVADTNEVTNTQAKIDQLRQEINAENMSAVETQSETATTETGDVETATTNTKQQQQAELALKRELLSKLNALKIRAIHKEDTKTGKDKIREAFDEITTAIEVNLKVDESYLNLAKKYIGEYYDQVYNYLNERSLITKKEVVESETENKDGSLELQPDNLEEKQTNKLRTRKHNITNNEKSQAEITENLSTKTDNDNNDSGLNTNNVNTTKDMTQVYKDGMDRTEAESILINQISMLESNIIKNETTGEEAKITKSTIGKLFSLTSIRKSQSNGFTYKQHCAVASDIINMFINSKKIHMHPDKNNDPNVKWIHRYTYPLGFNEGVAYITIKESSEHGKRIYSVECIEIGKLFSILDEVYGFDATGTHITPQQSLPENQTKTEAESVKGKNESKPKSKQARERKALENKTQEKTTTPVENAKNDSVQEYIDEQFKAFDDKLEKEIAKINKMTLEDANSHVDGNKYDSSYMRSMYKVDIDSLTKQKFNESEINDFFKLFDKKIDNIQEVLNNALKERIQYLVINESSQLTTAEYTTRKECIEAMYDAYINNKSPFVPYRDGSITAVYYTYYHAGNRIHLERAINERKLNTEQKENIKKKDAEILKFDIDKNMKNGPEYIVKFMKALQTWLRENVYNETKPTETQPIASLPVTNENKGATEAKEVKTKKDTKKEERAKKRAEKQEKEASKYVDTHGNKLPIASFTDAQVLKITVKQLKEMTLLKLDELKSKIQKIKLLDPRLQQHLRDIYNKASELTNAQLEINKQKYSVLNKEISLSEYSVNELQDMKKDLNTERAKENNNKTEQKRIDNSLRKIENELKAREDNVIQFSFLHKVHYVNLNISLKGCIINEIGIYNREKIK